MMKGKYKKAFMAVFCIYLGAIALACFLKPSTLPDMGITSFLGIPIDKVVHFLMFLPYPILAGMAFISEEQGIGRNIGILLILIVVGIGIAYGTEVIQAHTGYRSYEIADFHADLAGIATGSILTASYLTYNKFKK